MLNTPLRWWPLLLTLAATACATTANTEEDHVLSRLSEAPVAVDFLRQYAETWRYRLGQPAQLTPTPDGRSVLLVRSGPRSFERDLYELDVASGEERVVLTAEKLLGGAEETIDEEEKARRERMRLAARGIASFALSDDGRLLLVPLSGRLYVVERESGRVRELPSDGGAAIDPQLSPDGRFVATVRGGDVYVIDVDAGTQERLTTDASEHVQSGLAEFVAQEEMGRMHGTFWSPDGSSLAFQRTDTSKVEVFHIADPLHPEKAPSTWPYPRPGLANADVTLGVVRRTGGPVTWVEWDRERWPYLATVKWPEGAPLTLVVQSRAQQEEAVLAVDEGTGATTVLHVEADTAWLNLDQSVPRWLPDGRGFLWTTERKGAWQLELRRPDGSLDRTLTPPELGYRDLVDLDAKAGVAVVLASADPTRADLVRVPLAGGPPVPLVEGPGERTAVASRDHQLIVETTDGEGMPVTTVRDPDGRKLAVVRLVAEEPLIAPRVERTTVGPRQLRVAIVRPSGFDAQRRYPVLLHAYGGPHARMVSGSDVRYALAQWLAEQGFVVVSIDGRGTPDRGRDWERAIRSDLVAPPLDDQVEGLVALGARYPELDLSRVGVFGWSFGGTFAAMAVMRHPAVFRVGVAGAPVTDWQMYDTHYTERYLGLPDADPEAYARSSLLRWAKDLERPLLVIHGTADDNVYFLHGLMLTRALLEAGRPHGFLPLSGETHMVTDPDLVVRLYDRILSELRANLN